MKTIRFGSALGRSFPVLLRRHKAEDCYIYHNPDAELAVSNKEPPPGRKHRPAAGPARICDPSQNNTDRQRQDDQDVRTYNDSGQPSPNRASRGNRPFPVPCDLMEVQSVWPATRAIHEGHCLVRHGHRLSFCDGAIRQLSGNGSSFPYTIKPCASSDARVLRSRSGQL